MEEFGSDELPGDEELVARAAAGDTDAFHGLVQRHAQGLYRAAVVLVGNAQDAQDVVQETFAGAWHGLGKFESRASVKTWLRAILVRQAAQWDRRRRGGRRTLGLDAAQGVAGATPGVEARMDVHAAIARLGREHREVIVLREMEGMSYEEMAQALGVPRGTVESRLHRARRELQEMLKAYLP